MIPKSTNELLCLGQGLFLTKKGKVLWKVASIAIFWAIWLERNKRIFEEQEDNLESTWNRIRLWVAIWLYNYKDFKGIPFSLLVRD